MVTQGCAGRERGGSSCAHLLQGWPVLVSGERVGHAGLCSLCKEFADMP